MSVRLRVAEPRIEVSEAEGERKISMGMDLLAILLEFTRWLSLSR